MKTPWYPRYPEAFISSTDCRMMTLAEFGLYNWLLDYSWHNESKPCFLENDSKKLARLVGQPLATYLKAWSGVQKKFLLWIDPRTEVEYFYNPRLYEEYNKRIAIAQRQSEAGKQRAAKMWGGDSSANSSPTNLAIAKTIAPNSLQSTKEKNTLANASPKYPPDFEMFWANSTRRGSKLEASKIWVSLKPDDDLFKEIFRGMQDWRGSEQWQDETKQPHIHRWLKRRGWEELVPRLAMAATARPEITF